MQNYTRHRKSVKKILSHITLVQQHPSYVAAYGNSSTNAYSEKPLKWMLIELMYHICRAEFAENLNILSLTSVTHVKNVIQEDLTKGKIGGEDENTSVHTYLNTL